MDLKNCKDEISILENELEELNNKKIELKKELKNFYL